MPLVAEEDRVTVRQHIQAALEGAAPPAGEIEFRIRGKRGETLWGLAVGGGSRRGRRASRVPREHPGHHGPQAGAGGIAGAGAADRGGLPHGAGDHAGSWTSASSCSSSAYGRPSLRGRREAGSFCGTTKRATWCPTPASRTRPASSCAWARGWSGAWLNAGKVSLWTTTPTGRTPPGARCAAWGSARAGPSRCSVGTLSSE